MPEMMGELGEHLVFDPGGDFEAFVRAAPAKWVVYLFADEASRPIQLLCVKNLRYSLKHRLGGGETIGVSKRVNYREIVRHVYFSRVDSAFEADVVYFEAARRLFPESYQGMVGFRPAWFVHVNAEAAFPRYVKTVDVAAKAGAVIGPVEDKHAAARLIELAEDGFDLCRYYNVLVEAPHGKACAYKEMGKCPAPCDGSISMDQYRALVELSVNVLVDPGEYIEDQKRRMGDAAGELQFETASRIKTYIDQLSQLGKGPFRHARRLEDFRFISLQRGAWAGTAKVYLITPGKIEAIGCVIREPDGAGLLRMVLGEARARDLKPRRRSDAGEEAGEEAGEIDAGEIDSGKHDVGRNNLEQNDLGRNQDVAAPMGEPGVRLDQVGVERLGIVAHHLFSGKASQGVFIAMGDVTEKSLVKGYRDLLKQKQPEESEGEGVTKELQAMV